MIHYTGKTFKPIRNTENGKVRLHEEWEWTSRDRSKGKSILEEQ